MKRSIRKVLPVPFLLNALFCLITGALSLLLSQAAFLQSLPKALRWLLSHPGAAEAWGLLSLCAACLLCLLGRRSVSFGITALSAVLLALVSYYKTIVNGFPLLLSDLTLAGQALSVFRFALPRIDVSALTWGILLLAVILTVLLAFFDRRFSPAPQPAMVCLSLVLPLLLSCAAPGAILRTAAARVENCETQEERNERCGVFYGLYSAYAASRENGETTESEAQLSRLRHQLLTAPDAAVDGAPKRHFVFILSESFFDITRWEFLHFKEDPLPNFHRLCKTSESGTFLSSTFGGGTGWVELEVLTGFYGAYLSASDTIVSLTGEDAYLTMPSIPRLLHDGHGYETVYFHGYNSELFRRSETLGDLGFDTVAFDTDMLTVPERVNAFVSDRSFARELIARFEARTPGTPLFLQGTSMENHQPYLKDKYGALPCPVEYESDIPLDEVDRGVLESLLTGLCHADEALGTLTDYFAACGEPVTMVYYGDHLPSLVLSEGVSFYTHTGLVSSTDSIHWDPETLKFMLSTDYLIWSNDSEEASRGEYCSAQLGVYALRRSGLRVSPLYDWLGGVVPQKMRISRGRLFVSGDGTVYETAPEDDRQVVLDVRDVQHDLLYGRRALTDLSTLSGR